MSLILKRKRSLEPTEPVINEENKANLPSEEEEEEEENGEYLSDEDINKYFDESEDEDKDANEDVDSDLDDIDDFGNLNLSGSDYEEDDDDDSSGEWEDIGIEEKNGEESNDSDYEGSVPEDHKQKLSSEEKNKSDDQNESERQDTYEELAKKATVTLSEDPQIVTLSKGKSVKELKKKSALHAKSKAASAIPGKTKVTGTKIKKVTTDKSKKTLNEISTGTSQTFDEYATSDEEDLRNTIGNVPINWYDEYNHVGYGLDGSAIPKPKKGDALDKLLERLENPDYERMVFDKQTGQNVKLSDEDLKLVKRMLTHRVPDDKYDMYAPFSDLYSHEVMEMPLSGRASSKKSFLPSKSERQKVARLAYLIRRGLYKTNVQLKKEKKATVQNREYYDLWKPRGEMEPKLQGISFHCPAPPQRPPSHTLSYNPPPEYLMKNRDKLLMSGKLPEGGKLRLFSEFWRKFSSVREIPSYRLTFKERNDRLRDLYLGTRRTYTKFVAQSKDLLPKIPNKKDLRPYPTLEGIVFNGHKSIIRTISIHPNGKYLASGSDDHTVRIWETSTGRCLRTFEVEESVKKVSWNPNPKLFLLGIAMGTWVVFLSPETYLTDKVVVHQTNSIFKEAVDQGSYEVPSRVEGAVKWRQPTQSEWDKGYRVVLEHFKEVKEIVWHRQGDYFVTVVPDGQRRSVVMHQLSRWRSQLPFQGNKGRVQTIAFHPKRPHLFLLTQTNIRIYNLKRQKLIKKIKANCRWLSCIAIHPGGEHFLVGGYDRKVNWFEVECTKRPHLMRYHGNAVRSIKFHRKYPLFASCSDDRKLFVAHGMVYDDYLKDPTIVLLKQLKGHARFDDYYVLDLEWHPYEPFLFSAGADGTIRLWH